MATGFRVALTCLVLAVAAVVMPAQAPRIAVGDSLSFSVLVGTASFQQGAVVVDPADIPSIVSADPAANFGRAIKAIAPRM